MAVTDASEPRGNEPPRSVAEEAALLVDLLSERGWAGAGAPKESGAPETPRRGSGDECTCGGSRPQSCRLCPLCQLIVLVQQVSPESIDRLADIVDLAATGLRDLATNQRDRATRAPRRRADSPDVDPEGATDGLADANGGGDARDAGDPVASSGGDR